MPRYFSAADVCAVPSAYESFGMAAVEAMACGTPVVAFRTGGLAVTVKDGKTGVLAEPGDIAGFATGLIRQLAPGARDEMATRARMQASQFGWEQSVDHTVELYESLSRRRQCFCRWVAGA